MCKYIVEYFYEQVFNDFKDPSEFIKVRKSLDLGLSYSFFFWPTFRKYKNILRCDFSWSASDNEEESIRIQNRTIDDLIARNRSKMYIESLINHIHLDDITFLDEFLKNKPDRDAELCFNQETYLLNTLQVIWNIRIKDFFPESRIKLDFDVKNDNALYLFEDVNGK